VDSDEDSDDEFDNFDRVKKSLDSTSAAEGCAKLERAAQIFVQLDLEFTNGIHLPTIQVCGYFAGRSNAGAQLMRSFDIVL
jgi:hypothetical protein